MLIGCANCGSVARTAGFGAGAGEAGFSKTAGSGTAAIEGADGENAASGTGAGLIAGLMSDLAANLAANFEIGFGELRLSVELDIRFGAALGLDLESDSALESKVDMDEVSLALKLEGIDDWEDDNGGVRGEAGATSAVPGMRIVSTRIEV
jgi:hypothetical protein